MTSSDHALTYKFIVPLYVNNFNITIHYCVIERPHAEDKYQRMFLI